MCWGSDEGCEGGVVAEDGDGVCGRCEGSKGGSVMDWCLQAECVLYISGCFSYFVDNLSISDVIDAIRLASHTCTGVSRTGISELTRAAMISFFTTQSKMEKQDSGKYSAQL